MQLSSAQIIENSTKFERETAPSNIALWRGVVWQALLDLEKTKKAILRRSIFRWMFGKSDEFEQVCVAAMVNPSRIKEIARLIILKKHIIKKIR